MVKFNCRKEIRRARSTDHDKLTACQRFCHSDFSQNEGLGKMALGIVKYAYDRSSQLIDIIWFAVSLFAAYVPSNFMANRRVPKFSLNNCAQSSTKTFMCPKFHTNSVLKYTQCHISTNLSIFLSYIYYIAKNYLPLLQEIANSLKKQSSEWEHCSRPVCCGQLSSIRFW